MTTVSMQTIRLLHHHLLKRADKFEYDSLDRLVFKKFASKACYSLGRSTGGNMLKNKWFVILQLTFEAIPYPDDAQRFIEEFTKVACDNCRSYSLGLPRLRFMMDVIKAGMSVSARHGNPNVIAIVNRWIDQINDGDDDPRVHSRDANRQYVEKFAEIYGIVKMSCGHYEEISRRQHIRGNRESYAHVENLCRVCSASYLAGSTYVMQHDSALILREFAVDVHSGGGRTYISDRRAPSIRLVTHRGQELWVDGYWQPYGDLLGNYHSSRSKGFELIESPWFYQNRRAFGIELEVQSRTREETLMKKLGDVHEALNHKTFDVGEYCFFERDGSIGEGFEIVTQPAGLDVHTERLARFLQNTALKKGLRSHEGGSCGLHIHVGREFLTQAQIYRMQAFLNDSRNEILIRAIARRYDNGYSRIKRDLAKFTVLGKHSTDRYEALNITNVETVEFRIFRGSLRYESVIAALEFVNSLMTFCAPGSVSLTNFHAEGYKQWLQLPPNRVDTKHLRSYLAIGGDHATNELEAA